MSQHMNKTEGNFVIDAGSPIIRKASRELNIWWLRGSPMPKVVALLVKSFSAVSEKFPNTDINSPSGIEYDSEVNALYVWYRDMKSEESVVLDTLATTVADIGEDGDVVGVEILI